MKATMISILMAVLIPVVSQAKVEDFNAMITENGKAQTRLQEDLNQHLVKTRNAQNAVDSEYGSENDFLQSVNSPTDKGFMTFRKETVHYRASEEKQMERLANEIKALEAQF